MLIDTHCHINEADYPMDADEAIRHANDAGVLQMICVGTNEQTSKQAIDFAMERDGIFAAVGKHPHFASEGLGDIGRLVNSVYLENGFAPGPIRAPAPYQTRVADVSLNKGVQPSSPAKNNKLVAIGEIGLDYHYSASSRDDQTKLLEAQIQLAVDLKLPIIFHVREAFADFWPILDNFKGIRGVLHCFTDTAKNAEEGLKRGLYFGVNGISTFTRDEDQMAMFASLPIEKILLETDAPMLTPNPLRGKVKVNEPAFVKYIADHAALVHHVSVDELADRTSANAKALFNL